MPDAVLVLAWLVLAHFVADFVLQSGGLAHAKSSHGSRALGALAVHGLIVALCVAPAGLVFGERGWWLVLLTGPSHVAIDRAKVILTRRAAAAALRAAHDRHEGPPPLEHLAGSFLGELEAHAI